MKKVFLILFLFGIYFRLSGQSLTENLETIAKNNHVVGMTVCIVKSGQVVYHHNFGYRDFERQLPITDSTVFRIASISKMFTVTALMQLYDKNLFRLDDDVNKYLGFSLRNPNFPDQPITFQMLMSHTASLREGKGYDDFLEASYHQLPYPGLKSVLCKGEKYFTEDMWSDKESPNQHNFSYANINFGILGTLVEKISGERFDQYCIRHLFKPLNFNASFDVRDIIDINQVAVIYRYTDSVPKPQNDRYQGIKPLPRELSGYVPGSNAVLFAPQGGLRISAKDLTTFMLLHQNNGIYKGIRLLPDSSARLMHKVVWKSDGKNGDTNFDFFTNYSLGCMKTDKLIPGEVLIGHSGDAYGLLSDMYFSEQNDFGIVFISNGQDQKKGNFSGWFAVEEEVFRECFRELKKNVQRN